MSFLSDILDGVTQPLRDGVSLFEGLSEGELRTEAAARLGADVAAGMAMSEIVQFLRGEG